KVPGKFRTRSLVLAIAAATTTPVAAAASCENLATLAFPDTTITAAQMLPAGPTTIIGTTAPGTASPVFGTFTGTLPVAICRVRGEVACAQAGRERFARARLQDRESTE